MKKKDGKQLLKNISEYRAGKKKGVVLDIPDLGNSNYNFGWVCLEAGRSLMKLNKYNEALAVLDNVGRNTDDFSRVMAAESGGDVLATQHQWLRADNKSKSGKNKVKQKITKNKLAKKVKEILRQKKRISWWPKKGDSTALLKELVSLVKNDGSKAEVKDLNPDKAETEEAENKAESNKTPEKQTLPAEYSYNPFKEAVLEALLRRSKATAKIPYGKKAASKALKHLQVFFEEQYYGVYRGECILAVADYFLEYNIDLKQASRYYYMLDTWLRKVQQFDKKIATFDIPEKIKNISAPPDSNYNNDSWGNIIDSKNYPGNINNRRQSIWYLKNLRYRANMKLGIICYLNNNFAEAARLFLSLRKYDERCRKEEKEIWGSTAQRLAAAAKDEFGPRAENQYIRDFKGKKRIAATLGNFAYDALDFNKSEHIYLQLLNENLGRLSKNEKSYVLYMLGNIKHMQGMELKSIDYLSAFESERFKKTGIYAKALYTLCAIDVQCRMDGEYFEEIWKRCFPLLLKRCSKTTYAEKGLFGYAFVMERINVAKAINLYREYLKKYPNGKYRKIVKDHLLKKRSSKK